MYKTYITSTRTLALYDPVAALRYNQLIAKLITSNELKYSTNKGLSRMQSAGWCLCYFLLWLLFMSHSVIIVLCPELTNLS